MPFQNLQSATSIYLPLCSTVYMLHVMHYALLIIQYIFIVQTCESRGQSQFLLVESAEDRLMRSIIAREIHMLRPLCPPVNIRKYDLRPSQHNFLLPLRDDTNYIPRTLFRWLRPNL